MSQFKDSKDTLALPDEETNEPPEARLTDPRLLVKIHDHLVDNDSDGSRNRGIVQELMDFTPPFDPEELTARGQEDRFNVNFGLGCSIKNEAVGSFMDIYTSPERLVKIKLSNEVDSVEKESWEDIMSEEWTIMERSSDEGLPSFLSLADIFVTHGVGIAWFDDNKTPHFNPTGLDDMKFPKKTLAISSKVEVCTCEVEMALDELWRKIKDAPADADWHNGWNVPMVQKAILHAARRGTNYNAKYRTYEHVVREIKSNQLYVNSLLPSVKLIYGWVREYKGKVSIYAAVETPPSFRGEDLDEQWIFREEEAFDNANEAFQMFCYSVGHKMDIHTIRGLGYFIYEAAQADNILRNKAMESARMAASDVYQPETVGDAVDLEAVDIGPMVIVPAGLRRQEQRAANPLDRNILAVLEANEQVLERHAGGLAQSNYFRDSRARENTLVSGAAIEHFSKLNAFAIYLFYGPYDKLIREKVRRSFQVPQTNPVVKAQVAEMKQNCIDRGVPEEMFMEIDFKKTKAYRVIGNGSRSSRLMIYRQVSEMFASLDEDGQDRFVYDYLVELLGNDKAEQYKPRPGQRRAPQDVKIAMLENFQLMEGDDVERVIGENDLVHGDIHLSEIEANVEVLETGQMDYGDWAAQYVLMYRHASEHIMNATVHETLMPKLNSLRQRLQQMGEFIENGLKQLEKRAREAGEQQQQGEQGVGPDGQPVNGNGQQNGQMSPEDQAKIQKIFAVTQAEIQAMKQKTAAEIAMMKQKSMAKVTVDNAEAAAAMRRESVLR